MRGQKLFTLCKLWKFHSCVGESSICPGYDTASLSKWFLTLRKNVQLCLSRCLHHYPVIQCHILDVWISQPHHCENLEPSVCEEVSVSQFECNFVLVCTSTYYKLWMWHAETEYSRQRMDSYLLVFNTHTWVNNYPHYRYKRGPRWRSWLRHCATSQKVAGSIPDGVIGIFRWHNPSGCTVALGSTQPLTEMSTGNISWR